MAARLTDSCACSTSFDKYEEDTSCPGAASFESSEPCAAATWHPCTGALGVPGVSSSKVTSQSGRTSLIGMQRNRGPISHVLYVQG